ncbi:helicase-associated domain-containing protein [uncultured Cellulomonas sp.]|uniref:helicase-associated domain-containing protein n=1 Tax=uncultured Cellulomonas sp. TaxID=189682 RepID=UPI00262EED6E|nr:helicase-associated domain-containing protein [uncultured Cellulomonas sp.]
MATFSEHLRARSDPELVDLLARRPDLANPSPSTIASLAARAGSRVSLERALTGVDASVLQVLESVVALGGDHAGGAVPAADVARAVGATGDGTARTGVEDAVTEATALALLWGDDAGLHPSPGLADVLGPYPAGLGPVVDDVPDDLAPLLAEAPPAARSVLDALTWGPPVGRRPAADAVEARRAVEWLLTRGLLARADTAHVVLPRRVGLALRDGRTHAHPETHCPHPTGTVHPETTVEAESAGAAQEIVRLVAALVHLWERTPPNVLRSGGLGVRELRRAAGALETDEGLAALVVEVAGAAGFVVDDGEDPPAFSPTVDVDAWWDTDLAARWAVLAGAWLATPRTPWVVGGRDERGELRAALDPELARPWAPRLRRAVLEILAAREPGTALTADDVLTVLRWRAPRSVPPPAAVEAILREAGHLGVLGAGALSRAGRALLEPDAGDAAAAMAAALPEPVDDVLLQGDLTGIVPGRPTPALAALLDRATRVESRGAALTVRFTAQSVEEALDSGQSADELLAELAAHARGPLPQPLEYLVRDTARRHGRLRVGSAGGYVRVEDPTLLAGLVEDPALAELGLVRLAPTVLAAQVGPAALLAALRARGLAPAAERPDGQVVLARPLVRRVPGRGRRRRGAIAGAGGPAEAPVTTTAATQRLRSLVPALRRAEALQQSGAAPGAPGAAGTPDPVAALATLREAVADGREVWLEIVGPDGAPQRRRVRPVRVDGGRVRAVDSARDAELTVAVHRIAAVTPIDPEDAPS